MRGPEWAFAIPQGDLGALDDVLRRCSGFWNGVGSLIIPVTKSGRVPSGFDDLLDIRPVDGCFMHEALPARARDAIRKLASSAEPLHDNFDRREMHPLFFAEDLPDGSLRPSMFIPRFGSQALDRVALAAWGHMAEEDAPYWRQRFNTADATGSQAFEALIAGQVAPSASPLALSASNMRLITQHGPNNWPYLYVLDGATFNQIIWFWNLRARSIWNGNGSPVIGLPRQALRYPDRLRALRRWSVGGAWGQRTPDFYVSTSERTSSSVIQALGAIDIDIDPGTEVVTRLGGQSEPRERPTYRFHDVAIGGWFERGMNANTLMAFAGGKGALSLAAPSKLPRSGHDVRITLQNLPLPLPATQSLARRIHRNATTAREVVLKVAAQPRWNIDVQLPGAWDALEDWSTDHGYGVQLSQAGRYATALINRLGSLDGLKVLADDARFEILTLLTPESRLKLTQRLAAGLAAERGANEQQLAAHLVERIADIGLFLEVKSRSADELASLLSWRRPDALRAIAPLVEAGLVQRGQTTTCPQCNYTAFERLGALDETITCRACREQYVLPALDSSGRREPATTYQLDGLTARVMDQDLVPVLLALRALRNQVGASDRFFAWPGVELKNGSETSEVDLLVSTGKEVWLGEVKSNCANLQQGQLNRLLALAAELRAKPLIAGLDGEFSASLADAVGQAGGRVLDRSKLFA